MQGHLRLFAPPKLPFLQHVPGWFVSHSDFPREVKEEELFFWTFCQSPLGLGLHLEPAGVQGTGEVQGAVPAHPPGFSRARWADTIISLKIQNTSLFMNLPITLSICMMSV